jgi:hypothetical protein
MAKSSRSLAWLGCLAPVAFIVPIMMFLAIWQFLSPATPPITMVPFSQFMAEVRADPEREPHVQSVRIHGQEIVYFLRDPRAATMAKRGTVGPADTRDLVKELGDRHIAVTFEAEEPAGSAPSGWLFLLFAFGGFVVAGIALALMVRAQAELSRTRARLAEAQAEIARLTAEAGQSPGAKTIG